jgi:iron(III) transport system ATP-binding protein
MADLRIEGLGKAFAGKPVLRGVDLSVASGSLVAVLGASGSGKTTLLRLICGFERADSGTIRIGDDAVCGPGLHLAPERRRIGYVAQEGALFPHLSVADNIVFGLPRHLRRRHARVADLLALVGLPSDYARRPPQELSGGEQQRVALARALAPAPRLVLLDEPFSALDAALRVQTRQAVTAALSAAGATALLVTHDQSEALSVGDRVAVLRDGRLAQVADPRTLYRAPADPQLAQFVGDAVLLPGVARDGHAQCSLGLLRLAQGAPDGPVDLLVRPEQILLATGTDAPGVRARVVDATFYGHDASVLLRLSGNGEPVTLTARVAGHVTPWPGQDVALTVEGDVVAYPSTAG